MFSFFFVFNPFNARYLFAHDVAGATDRGCHRNWGAPPMRAPGPASLYSFLPLTKKIKYANKKYLVAKHDTFIVQVIYVYIKWLLEIKSFFLFDKAIN